MFTKNRNETLDLVRGLSAVAVMASHLRGFLIDDFGKLASPGVLAKLFYFATGLGNQAVMIFFVLSGFFVGGGVCKALKSKRFSWLNYAIARLIRLWMALLPALLLTLACDLVGRHFAPDIYNGSLRHLFCSGPTPGENSFTPGAFFGNLIFLQTIKVSCFGSNAPLWSLANEFWYYVLFPLAACSCVYITRTQRNLPLALGMWTAFGLIAWLLPTGLVCNGLIWLMGVGVWWVSTRPSVLRVTSHPVYFALTGAFFLGCLVATKTQSVLGRDFVLGTAFALWLCSLLAPRLKDRLLGRIGIVLSEISYTLYVVHFPIQFFIASTFLKGHRLSLGFTGICWFALCFILCLGASALMWFLFERRTNGVRQRANRFFARQMGKGTPVHGQTSVNSVS